MIIGVPKEVKNNENRVSVVPASVSAFVNAGHTVWIEKGQVQEAASLTRNMKGLVQRLFQVQKRHGLRIWS